MSQIKQSDHNPVDHVEWFLDGLDIAEQDIGIVLGPRIDDEQGAVEIMYNVRILDEDYSHIEIDGTYTFSDLGWEAVMEDIYPEMVSDFETRFEEATITYYE